MHNSSEYLSIPKYSDNGDHSSTWSAGGISDAI